MPKYLRGNHNCTKEDMITLGGLLFRSKVDSDRSQFVMIPRMLSELVPADKIKIMSPEDWKKVKEGSYTLTFVLYKNWYLGAGPGES